MKKLSLHFNNEQVNFTLANRKLDHFNSANRDPDNPGGLIVMGEALYGQGRYKA